jgi:hypothetical protein
MMSVLVVNPACGKEIVLKSVLFAWLTFWGQVEGIMHDAMQGSRPASVPSFNVQSWRTA